MIAFGFVFVAYQFYALVVPPLLASPGVRAQSVAATESDWQGGSDAVRRYQKLFAHYLPTGHWALTGPIKVLESGSMLLVFEDWRRDNAAGRVQLTKCAAILFPTPRGDGRDEGPLAPRDAVVMEAVGDPQLGYAADLQFEGGFDPARGQVGKIASGRFPGPITIRSDGLKPGIEDDLWIETSDLRLTGTLLDTPQEVHLRYGLNRGSGRRLEIKLIEERGGGSGSGLNLVGVESMEVFEQVRLELHTGGIGFGETGPRQRVTQGDARIHRTAHTTPIAASPVSDPEIEAWTGPLLKPAAKQPTQPAVLPAPTAPQGPAIVAAPPPPAQPINVTCKGSFRMDTIRFVASFYDRVHAWQLNLGGQSDQLACQRLDLHFTDADTFDDEQPLDPQNDLDFARRQQAASRNLRPRRLVAYGEPVKLDAPARGAVARGRQLEIELETRRVTLSGAGAFLKHTAGEVHAPLVRYEHPQPNARTPIGQLWVGGPGWLRTTKQNNKRNPSEQGVVARWNATPGIPFPVQLRQRTRGSSLVVVGNPEITAASIGKIKAQRVELSLLETPVDGPAGPAIEFGDHPTALLPEKITAKGAVAIDAPQLLGRTDELTAWLRPRDAQSGRAAGRRPLAARNVSHSSANRTTSPDRYQLTAQRMELDVQLAPGAATPQRLVCIGAAQFRQQPSQPDEQPLVVTGDRIRVDRLHTEHVRVDVLGGERGAEVSGASQRTLATIAARGVTISAADVHLDQQTNRMWADGAGRAQLRTTQDLIGQATDAATDLHLRWQGGMMFDGQRIIIEKDVLGEGPHDWVRANKLIVTLTEPIQFKGKSNGLSRGERRVEVARVDASGSVTIDHRSVDERGQRSHERAELQTLSYEHRTGALSGRGPGWIRSVHLSSGKGLGGLAQQGDNNRTNSAERLRFLRVHFRLGVTGNLNDRVIGFREDVRAVYGPVLAWQHEIPLDNPNGLPADTATLSADYLQVNEDPQAARALRSGTGSKFGPLELFARGNVDMETARKKGGVFTAQSTTASYTQAKELFTIEGVPGDYATIWIQDQPGRPAKVQTARKFKFWRKTNQLEVEDLGGFDSSPATRTPAARPGTAPARSPNRR